jgi:hypothetical protein
MGVFNFKRYKEAEWVDFSITIGGSKPVKILGVRYKAKKEKEPIYGEGDEPLDIQSGNRSYEGQIKLRKGAVDDLNTAAQAAGADDILDVTFDVICHYKPRGSRPPQTDILESVDVTEFEMGWDQGAKSMEVTLPIVFLKLRPERG